MKARDFRDQSVEELEATLTETRKKLFELTNEKKQAKQIDKPHQLGLLKKDIARIKTIINEKQSVAQQG